MTRVLIADDSASVRLMLRSWLEGAGYTVEEAADGLEAIERVRTAADPLVVLLDYEMPGLTGYEVLQRALAEGLAPPRFGYVSISGMQGAFPPAFNDLLRQLRIQMLPKPFDQDALLMVTAFVAARQGMPVPEPVSAAEGAPGA
jgi:CheY-like chemotaxis protein